MEALEEVAHLSATQAARLFFTLPLPLCCAHPAGRGLIKSKARHKVEFCKHCNHAC
jgi:hypothetical protein